MFRINFALFALCILMACSSETTLEFSSTQINSEQLKACINKPCPNVAIDYPMVISTQGEAHPVNQLIQTQLGKIISGSILPEGELITTVKPAVNAFVSSFQDYMGDFPNGVMEYDLDIDSYVSFQNNDLLTVTTNFYIFTGGAHGYGGTQFINIDAQTLTELALEELISDLPGFTKMVELKFREVNSIPIDDNINSTGFWFENDSFSLAQAYGFTQDGFEMIYNTYEITSYVDGPQSLVISFEEMEPWLNSHTAF